jgi:hypothetical protein
MAEAVQVGIGAVSGGDIRISCVLEIIPEAEQDNCLRDKREGK